MKANGGTRVSVAPTTRSLNSGGDERLHGRVDLAEFVQRDGVHGAPFVDCGWRLGLVVDGVVHHVGAAEFGVCLVDEFGGV